MRQSQKMALLACDIMESPIFENAKKERVKRYHRIDSLRSLSVDSTYKLPLKVADNMPGHQHTCVTVVGIHGSIIAAEPANGEAPEEVERVLQLNIPVSARTQVQHLAVDAANKKLLVLMKALFPKLDGISLDPLHLVYNVEGCRFRRRSRPGLMSVTLRAILDKFNQSPSQRDMGSFYRGEAVVLTTSEKRMLDLLTSGTMPFPRAKSILKAMNPNTGMKTRHEFIALLSALAALYPKEMEAPVDGPDLLRCRVASISLH